MRKDLRKYLVFTRSERNAAIIAVFSILIAAGWPFILSLRSSETPDTHSASLLELLRARSANELNEFDLDTDAVNVHGLSSAYIVTDPYAEESNKQDVEHFPSEIIPFDPDTISAAQWVEMGLPRYVAERIIKYREKGGSFKEPADLQKIYGFPQDVFVRIAPYVRIHAATQSMQEADAHAITAEYTGPVIELNSADTEQLLNLGFSPGDATRILRFREQAGGFYHAEQLFGMYALDASKVEKALKWLEVERNSVIKINLNTTDSVTLAKHIYISDALAGAIVRYREQTGKYYTLNEVLKVKGMYPDLFEKLKPYLQI